MADGGGRSSTALEEGRRVYLGNLAYSVKPQDIEALLVEQGFGQFDKMEISVDPVSGRNPGYCFIEFSGRADADRFLGDMAGVQLHGRALKTGPCQPKASQRRADHQKPLFERWGDWKADRRRPGEQGPHAAIKHMDDVSSTNKRLYVGGLGMMLNQEENDKEIRALFHGFDMCVLPLPPSLISCPHDIYLLWNLS
jgi:hypothetical protein